MSYQPNWQDPRVIARVIRAYGFARGVLSTTKPHAWSSRYIDRYFGCSSHQLSRYLRGLLLVCVDNRYSKDSGKCKEYLLNELGADYLRGIIRGEIVRRESEVLSLQYPSVSLLSDLSANCQDSALDSSIVCALWRREHDTELKNLAFDYTDKEHRLWNPIQNVKREYRQQILAEAGLTHEYDIVCCAPTLLLRQAQQLGMDLWLPAYSSYLENRAQIRQRLSRLTGLDEQTIKVVLNALFCGARLGENSDFALTQLLGNNVVVIRALKNDAFIQQLQSDIRVVWQELKQLLPVIYIEDRNGKQRRKAASARHKWQLYFKLERNVLDVVRTYLRDTNNPVFLIHDGWTTRDAVDIDTLVELVYTKTKMKIQIEHKGELP